MDVIYKSILMVFIASLLSACQGGKTVENVFPEKDDLSSSACSGTKMSQRFIVQWENGEFSTVEFSTTDDFVENFLNLYLNQIRHVEYDRLLTFQVADSNPHASINTDSWWGPEKIEAPFVWNRGHFGENVPIGIVDSSVDVSHPSLTNNILYNLREIPANGIDDDSNGFIDDHSGYDFISFDGGATGRVNPHGTHVAGIVAAANITAPMHGIAPRAKIIPSAFISNNGSGGLGDAIMALQYVARRGAKIINASWGGAPCVMSLKNAFLELERQGILVVVAAGNAGKDLDRYPEFPASFNLSNQITVGATSSTDFMTSWSNSGFNFVHVVAPGSRILSTVPAGFDYFDGTSMSAPYVTGAAAVLWGAFPLSSAQEIRAALLRSVDTSAYSPYRVQSRGRLNLRRAFEYLERQNQSL